MNEVIAPARLAPPVANYAHAVLTTAPARMLHTAGVVPVDAAGAVPDRLVDQAELVWANLAALLAEAAMGPRDVVSVTTYVVAGEDLGPVMAARDRAMGGHLAASTLVTVPALARPEWRVEVSLVAASFD